MPPTHPIQGREGAMLLVERSRRIALVEKTLDCTETHAPGQPGYCHPRIWPWPRPGRADYHVRLQAHGPAITPSPGGITPERWRQDATVCPPNWPTDCSLLGNGTTNTASIILLICCTNDWIIDTWSLIGSSMLTPSLPVACNLVFRYHVTRTMANPRFP